MAVSRRVVLLFTLARGIVHGCIVEVGSYRGRSTVALACRFVGSQNRSGIVPGDARPVFEGERYALYEAVDAS
jgi:hypothetical protein